MKLYAKEKSYELYNGDILDMKEVIKDNSIDSIVCDPPYGLTSITKRFGKDGSFSRLSKGFMNESWDGSGIEYNVEAWRKCYDVLKPGGYLLAFGGTRTYHRIACAIEDAGFEIKDCIMWLYGSGFPKSQNVGIMIDKKNGIKSIDAGIPNPNARPNSTKENTLYKSGFVGKNCNIKIAQNKFAGYGTCLKPAYEPIIMARKPVEKTIADNCLKYGVGAININECRIPFENTTNPATNPLYRQQNKDKYKQIEKGQESNGAVNFTSSKNDISNLGRFPANVIHDGSEEAIKDMNANENDASRYFYCAKASKKDRDEGLEFEFEFNEAKTTDGYIRANKETARKFGANSSLRRNIHPTVKPTELMQYLVRLVSPSGATILDPFMGSGSTGKAIMFENRERNVDYKFIGIDLTDKYLPIAKARIDYALNQYEYDAKEKEIKTEQMSLFDYKEK